MPEVSSAAKGALTRKVGPLPVWGWGVAIGGGILAFRYLRGSTGGSAPPETIVVPTGAPQPSAEYLSDVGSALQDVRERIDWLAQEVNNNQDDDSQQPAPSTPPPPGSPPITDPIVNLDTDAIGRLVISLRTQAGYDPYTPSGPNPPGANQPGETAEQRRARLLAEYRRLVGLPPAS